MELAVGDGSAFAAGRDIAAWLGLVPRQQTTGSRPRLLGISKRGNRYLRKHLIHGARSVLPLLAQGGGPLGLWLASLLVRAHKNKVVVALANKLARISGKRSFVPRLHEGCGAGEGCWLVSGLLVRA